MSAFFCSEEKSSTGKLFSNLKTTFWLWKLTKIWDLSNEENLARNFARYLTGINFLEINSWKIFFWIQANFLKVENYTSPYKLPTFGNISYSKKVHGMMDRMKFLIRTTFPVCREIKIFISSFEALLIS